MALAQLSNVLSRAIALLGANPGVFTSTVSGNVGAFPSDAELNLAALEADEWVVTRCYFQSPNPKLSEPFETLSSDLPSGSSLPFTHGKISKVELSPNEATWETGVMAASRDDIVQAAATEAYYGAGKGNFLYYIDDEGHLYHLNTYARVTYPEYVRTAALQANQNDESLIVFKMCALLTRNASPALFAEYSQKAELGRQAIIGQEGDN